MSNAGVQPKMEKEASNRRMRCSCTYSSVPPRPVRKVRKAKIKTKPIMKILLANLKQLGHN